MPAALGASPRPQEQVTTSTEGLSIAPLQVFENKTIKYQTQQCSKKSSRKNQNRLTMGGAES